MLAFAAANSTPDKPLMVLASLVSLGSNPPPQIVLPTDGDRQGIDCTFKATLDKNPTPVAPGAQLFASISATDSDPLTFDWYLIGGSSAGYSGDVNAAQKDPQDFVSTTTIALKPSASQTLAGVTKSTITFTAEGEISGLPPEWLPVAKTPRLNNVDLVGISMSGERPVDPSGKLMMGAKQ